MMDASAGGPHTHWPLNRGFDRFYGFLEGETNQFYPSLFNDNHSIDPPYGPEEGYHLTEDLIDQSERVYNWQRAMNVWLGKGRRMHDLVPYRSMGPVTEMEYMSRKDRYDGQLVEILNLAKKKVNSLSVTERMKLLYDYRQGQYRPLPWTYPDYSDPVMLEYLQQVRRKYALDLKSGKTK